MLSAKVLPAKIIVAEVDLLEVALLEGLSEERALLYGTHNHRGRSRRGSRTERYGSCPQATCGVDSVRSR